MICQVYRCKLLYIDILGAKSQWVDVERTLGNQISLSQSRTGYLTNENPNRLMGGQFLGKWKF